MAPALIEKLLEFPNVLFSIIIFTSQNKYYITIGSNILQDAIKLAEKDKNRLFPCEINVLEEEKLCMLIKPHELVVSFVPNTLHMPVFRSCIKERKHLLTTSYVTDEMLQYEDEIKNNGLIFLKECGLDPGIDHILTKKIQTSIIKEGGKLLEFESWCGGLPSPDSCDNPLGWAPKSALMILFRPAKYIDQGQIVEIPQGSHLLYKATPVEINMSLNLEGYPNRDSTKYVNLYNIPECQKVIRGTLRYKGFAFLMRAFIDLGFFRDDVHQGQILENKEVQKKPIGMRTYLQQHIEENTYNVQGIKNMNFLITEKDVEQLLDQYDLNVQENISYAYQILKICLTHKRYQHNTHEDLIEKSKHLLRCFKWFGFFEDNIVVCESQTPLDIMVNHFQQYLQYEEGQTDIVILQNQFKYINNRNKIKTRKISLIKFGEEKGHSAMSQCVATPAAIGCQLILEGIFKKPGIHIPTIPELYEPMLDRVFQFIFKIILNLQLEKYGFKFNIVEV